MDWTYDMAIDEIDSEHSSKKINADHKELIKKYCRTAYLEEHGEDLPKKEKVLKE